MDLGQLAQQSAGPDVDTAAIRERLRDHLDAGEITTLCDALDAARLDARNNLRERDAAHREVADRMAELDAARAENRDLRAENARLRANVLQEQAWNTKRTEEFTGTLAGTVATAEAEIVTATAALTQQRDDARARLDEIRALCDRYGGDPAVCVISPAEIRAILRDQPVSGGGPAPRRSDDEQPVDS